MIALLCPSRARPDQCKRMVESINSTERTAVFLAMTADECEEFGYDRIKGSAFVCMFSMPDNLPTSHKWNWLAQTAMTDKTNNLFMLAADDMVFTTPGWDKAIIDHYNALPEGRKQHVYALRDSRDENGTPHIIVTREWIETMGYFVPPIFLHWFIDSWTVDMAKSAGCFTHLKDYELMHLKPSDEGKPDETHSRIRQWGWHDRDKYVAETCRDWLELQKSKLAMILACGEVHTELRKVADDLVKKQIKVALK
jgi:hypothetical protein